MLGGLFRHSRHIQSKTSKAMNEATGSRNATAMVINTPEMI